jgi:hypothetical protein
MLQPPDPRLAMASVAKVTAERAPRQELRQELRHDSAAVLGLKPARPPPGCDAEAVTRVLPGN